MDEHIEILKEGKYIRFLRRGDWEYVQRVNCSGIVIIIAMTDEQKLLFVRQYRAPVNSDVIEFPAGLVNDGCSHYEETAAEAAKRELLEETGYEAGELIQVLSGPGGAGASSDILTFFLARKIRKVSDGGGDESERITTYEIPLQEVEGWLKAMAGQGIPADPKIYAGLYFLKTYNKNS